MSLLSTKQRRKLNKVQNNPLLNPAGYFTGKLLKGVLAKFRMRKKNKKK